jgi:sugar lactone lactonase YvrE
LTLTTRVLADGFAATECPRWLDGRLYFSDMHGGAVFSVAEDGRLDKLADVNGPGGIGFLPDGRMLVVSQRDRLVHRLDPDGLKVHADLSSFGDSWINDMWVHASGNAYVGEMGFDIHGLLAGTGVTPCKANVYLVRPDGSVEVAADEMAFPNGIVVADDGRTLIVAESFALQLTAFDIDSDGSLKNRREWATLGFAPDGIAIDGQGHVWVADPQGARAVRVAPDGTQGDVVMTDRVCLSCAVGGASEPTLFLCTTKSTDPREAPGLQSSRIETASLSSSSH